MDRKTFLKTGLIGSILGFFIYKTDARDYSKIIKHRFNAERVVKTKSGTYIVYLKSELIKNFNKLKFNMGEYQRHELKTRMIILDANKTEDTIPFHWLENI